MKCKRKEHLITIKNTSNNEELFEKYKSRIVEEVERVLKNNFEKPISLNVLVEDSYKEKNKILGEDSAAFMSINTNKDIFTLRIGLETLKRIEFDNGLGLDEVVYHELAHLSDYVCTKELKHCPKNIFKSTHRYVGEFILSHGLGFWNEFFAYFNTYRAFKEFKTPTTFLRLVKGYETLEEKHEKLIELFKTKGKRAHAEAEEFMNIIREYIYALAKFLAGDIMGKASYYRYSEKTRQKKSFKKVVRICDKILSKIEPIFTNMYGKVHFRKLYRLGEELIAQIYVPFDIYPAKYHFRARFILSFSSESKD